MVDTVQHSEKKRAGASGNLGHSSDGSHEMIEHIGVKEVGYGDERDPEARADVVEENNPNVYPHVRIHRRGVERSGTRGRRRCWDRTRT
jgi:hypothetical protein